MPRPPTKTGLNDASQRELVWWLAKGLPKEEAAKRAGLPSSSRLYHFTRTKQFADELREALTDHMSTELAPKAVRILDEIMSDDKVTPRVRVDAAKALMDRAGYSPAAIDPDARRRGSDASLAEMSMDDLRAFVAYGRAEMEARAIEAKTIEAKTIDPAERFM